MEIDYDGRFLMQKRCYLRSKKMINQPVDHSRDGPFKNVPVLDWGDGESPRHWQSFIQRVFVLLAYILLAGGITVDDKLYNCKCSVCN